MIKDLPRNPNEETVIGENVRVTGKLHTSSSIVINGHVKGEVVSEGKVTIGKTGEVDGPIQAKDVKIEGAVKGNIIAKNQLDLDSQAKVFGDLQAKILSVKAGAIFNGKSTMSEEKEEIASKKEKTKPAEKEEPEPELEIE